MAEVKLAVYGAGGCSGCELTLLEDPLGFLDITAVARVVFWPLLVNDRLADLAELPDGSLAVAVVCGGLRTDQDLKVVELCRRKGRRLLAVGSCALWGGVPALVDLPPGFNGPLAAEPLPALLPRVLPVAQVVPVDGEVPGCPPVPGQLTRQVLAMLELADQPPTGERVLGLTDQPSAGETAVVCADCQRRREGGLTKWRRFPEVAVATGKCFLDQGLVCSGPATRGGCGARCPGAGVPCRGCYGPVPGVGDHGARLLSGLAAVLEPDGGEEGEGHRAVDLAGTLYRYTLAASLVLPAAKPR